MFVLGLQGSPRLEGNTSRLLAAFLAEAQRYGARVETIAVAAKEIHGCVHCGHCERTGFCSIDDEMQGVYPLLRKAELIVVATPVFFYNVPAQLKALIDRSQTLWSRRYLLKLEDPGRKWRKGFLLSVGATKGPKLFDGLVLTARYFFDAVGASFAGSLTYRNIEKEAEVDAHPGALQEAREKAKELVVAGGRRKKVLFVCRENSCRSQMAGALTQYHGGDKIEVESAGSAPADAINPLMVQAMAELGIDMVFRRPQSVTALEAGMNPDLVISMGCEAGCPFFPGATSEDWGLEDPAGKPIECMRKVRDEIVRKVETLVKEVRKEPPL